MWDAEVNQTMYANCGDLASHDVAVIKSSVANAKAGQGNLLMMVLVARRLPWSNGQLQLSLLLQQNWQVVQMDL